MGQTKMRTRAETEERFKWNLKDIYEPNDAWEQEFEKAKAQGEAFAGFAGRLGEGKTVVLEALNAYFDAAKRMTRLFCYASMSRNGDNGDPVYQALQDRAMTLWTKNATASAFLSPELLALPEETLVSYAADPAFADYDVFLKDLLRQKAHTLSSEMEQLVAATQDMAQGVENTVEMLTDVDMRFGTIRDEQGEEVELTDANYRAYIESRDRAVRKAAFERMMNTYGGFGNTFAAAYAGNVKKDLFYATVRHFPSARAAALFPDEVPESVYDSLIDAMHAHLPGLARYVALRGEVLDLKEVHMYDLYTPMVKDFELEVPYDKGFEIIKKALAVLGDDYVQVLCRAKDERWIDVYENRGKTSGAYSNGGAYDVHPYILTNYVDTLDSMLTLAHELGHTMHSYYSNKEQPFAKSDYAIFVAEVASTVNEVLTIEYLRETYRDDQKAQAALCNHLLENFRTTVFRQTMFAEFEHKAHRMAETGEALTRESLCAMYKSLNDLYYGQQAFVDAEIANEWMRIPHFYNAFYVYKYATSFCAAVAIARRIREEGESAVKAYRHFLTTGGSMPPIEELKLVGIDMSTPAPVESALCYFEELIDRLSALQKA